MCGICGIYAYGTSEPRTLESIDEMTSVLAHRGPDGQGTWARDRLALGHRRLSIFDLSAAGKQPMSSSDGSVVVSFNGEIFNHTELRETLAGAGVAFRTRTDTEVLIEWYRVHGIAGVEAFRGMFAFALWDERRKSLFVVRDRFGIKPLYYVNTGGVLVFASEVKSLLAHPMVRPVLDRDRFAEWLALRYTTAPGTLFEGVRKLEPGHYLEAGQTGVRDVCYWDIEFRPTEVRDPEEAVARFGALLRESVRLRMRSDVPVGIFLSGGLDSSAIALEAAEVAGGPLETFTVGYLDSPELSELERARKVANQLGSNHHELILDKVDPSVLTDVVRHLEEPVGDPATVLVYRLSEFTRPHVTVVLSGEGSDETNLGYTSYHAFRRYAGLRSRRLLGPLLEYLWLYRNARESLVRGLGGADVARVYAELRWPGSANRAQIAGDGTDRWLSGLRGALDSRPAQVMNRLIYLNLKGWLGDDLLLKMDKTTMAFALEGRVPFLDHHLVEFNLSLPLEWKLGPEGTKLLLRRWVRGRLPESTVEGRQRGFLAPLGNWFSSAWQRRIEHALGPDGLGKRRILPRSYLDGVLSGIRARRSEDLRLGFMLASLDTWFDVFKIEG